MFLRSRESLTREIEQKFESVKENEATARKKRRWCDSLEQIIREVFPTRQLVLVGSSTNGFAIEGSDVDMTLIRTERMTHYGYFSSEVQVLRRIRDALRERPVIDTEVISTIYAVMLARQLHVTQYLLIVNFGPWIVMFMPWRCVNL